MQPVTKKQKPKITLAVWLTNSTVACWALNPRQLRRLKTALPNARVIFCKNVTEFHKALPEAQAAIIKFFDPAWLALAPKLEWLSTPAAGQDYFHASRPGLERTYGSFHGRIMGQTLAAMVLAVNRGLLTSFHATQTGKLWPLDELSSSMRTLDGTHAVILGFGHIGEWFARYLKPFGVRITGVRRHPRTTARPDCFTAGDRIVSLKQLDALLPTADHLILALPATPETNRLINAQRLAKLKPTASIYNFGRGNAIDEGALAQALADGRLHAAGLDVFQEEPLPTDSPLRTLPNVLLLPHASSITPEYLDLYLDEFIPMFRAKYP